MATPFKTRMRTAALANAGLAALISSNWYDTQLPQAATFPAVVMQQITGPRMYSNVGRLATFWGRFQFTIWGGRYDAGAQARDNVFQALMNFLDSTPFDGVAGRTQSPNFIVGDRDALYPQTDGPIYQKIVDAMIFQNETL